MSVARLERIRGAARPLDVPVMRHRVVYADTDAMGIVYHGRYFEIAERSRVEYIAGSRFDPAELEQDHGIVLVVNRLSGEYRTPIRLHAGVDVTTSVLKAGVSQIWWRTQFHVEGQLAATIDVGTGCFHVPSRETVVMPPAFADCIAAMRP